MSDPHDVPAIDIDRGDVPGEIIQVGAGGTKKTGEGAGGEVRWADVHALTLFLDVISDLYTDRMTGKVFVANSNRGYVEAQCDLPIVRGDRGVFALTKPVRIKVPLGVLRDHDWRWVGRRLLGSRGMDVAAVEHPWLQGEV